MKKSLLFLFVMFMGMAGFAQNHWVPNENLYADNLNLTGIIQIDGVEQNVATLEVGAFCGSEVRGSIMPMYIGDPVNRHLIFFTIYGESGDVITFKLFDHQTNTVLNVTSASSITFVPNEIFGDPLNPYVLNFVSSHQITASANPAAGGTVTGAGTYTHGENVTLTATANSGYTFVNWTENGTQVATSAAYTFEATSDRTLVANFQINSFNVNAVANPVAGGSIAGTGTYNQGVTATLTATANAGYAFVNWTENGTQVSTSASYSFEVTRARNLVANFSLNSYNISATINPVVGGTISGTGTYGHGANVTLTATPNAGYTFVNWTENGTEVSNSASYSFEVTRTRTLVANFQIKTYTISASANPAASGNVSGAGTYTHGENVAMTATANTGYAFVNWTENGTEVSANSTYTFAANANRALVANFIENSGYENYWNPDTHLYADNLSIMAIVKIDGVEQRNTFLEVGAFCGSECRGSAILMYVGGIVDRYLVYLTVYGEANDVISFKLYNHEQNAVLNLAPPASITFVANDVLGLPTEPYVLGYNSTLPITASANPAEGGTITGTGDYVLGATATLTATANTGFVFENWTENGTVVSSNSAYSFTVASARTLVANFNHIQTTSLLSGWNWYSTYITVSGASGLAMLTDNLGTSGMMIKSQSNGFVANTGGFWSGSLTAINNQQMYMIKMNSDLSLNMTGSAVNPASTPISLYQGWNWISYPLMEDMSVASALAGITPNSGDLMKSQNGFSSYIAGMGWFGALNTLNPGSGYMYKSIGTSMQTLTYPSGRRSEMLAANVMPSENHWIPDMHKFADNMSVMAVINLDGKEQNTDNLEVAAFAGDECRGSARPIYIEPLNRYIAFLTIYGNDNENIVFRLYDVDNEQEWLCPSSENVVFKADDVFGSLAEPYVLNFGNMLNVNEVNDKADVMVYPNPVRCGENIMIEYPYDMDDDDNLVIEIVNSLGMTVRKEISDEHSISIDGILTSGVYIMKITAKDSNRISYVKFIVK